MREYLYRISRACPNERDVIMLVSYSGSNIGINSGVSYNHIDNSTPQLPRRLPEFLLFLKGELRPRLDLLHIDLKQNTASTQAQQKQHDQHERSR